MPRLYLCIGLALLLLSGCASPAPAPAAGSVEVTRVVAVTVPPIEVTRVVKVTVPVEVTRVVEQTVAPIVVTATPAPTQPAEKLGDTARGYGYALTAEGVTDPAAANQFHSAKPGTRLVAVTVVLANESGETRSSNLLNAVLIDAEGFTYEANSGLLAEEIELIDLRPGNKIRGAVGFEIPDKAQPARLRWTVDGSLGDQFLEVGLAR